ncbi:MAG: hypothetical protein QM489_02880 [Candidatus Izemoplasma sp.]
MRHDFIRMTKGDALRIILKTGIGFYIIIAINIYWINKMNTDPGTELPNYLYGLSAVLIVIVWSIMYALLILRISFKQKQIDDRRRKAVKARKENENNG